MRARSCPRLSVCALFAILLFSGEASHAADNLEYSLSGITGQIRQVIPLADEAVLMVTRHTEYGGYTPTHRLFVLGRGENPALAREFDSKVEDFPVIASQGGSGFFWIEASQYDSSSDKIWTYDLQGKAASEHFEGDYYHGFRRHTRLWPGTMPGSVTALSFRLDSDKPVDQTLLEIHPGGEFNVLFESVLQDPIESLREIPCSTSRLIHLRHKDGVRLLRLDRDGSVVSLLKAASVFPLVTSQQHVYYGAGAPGAEALVRIGPATCGGAVEMTAFPEAGQGITRARVQADHKAVLVEMAGALSYFEVESRKSRALGPSGVDFWSQDGKRFWRLSDATPGARKLESLKIRNQELVQQFPIRKTIGERALPVLQAVGGDLVAITDKEVLQFTPGGVRHVLRYGEVHTVHRLLLADDGRSVLTLVSPNSSTRSSLHRMDLQKNEE